MYVDLELDTGTSMLLMKDHPFVKKLKVLHMIKPHTDMLVKHINKLVEGTERSQFKFERVLTPVLFLAAPLLDSITVLHEMNDARAASILKFLAEERPSLKKLRIAISRGDPKVRGAKHRDIMETNRNDRQ